MAEFSEVMKQRNRMCKKYWTERSCHGCPVAEEKQAYEGCCLIDLDPKRYEELVLQWAEEHPEPVYPTWYEVMAKLGVIDGRLGDKTLGEHVIEGLIHHRIPADIAEKLGLEPREG